ncbi:hypothetical protein GCM10011360_19200 [Primorskyibacter flagellatus]|uniref:NADH dehydrogenase subunit E n=1 Tax=Primorskyibacter flagellatus TaxID=1387277 RepID=A0A917A6T1_9RHOB|nr:endonuclease [Primorskyibacter flagellatus]GGE31417.1 hypothetical protein GCM10011360_19200 [Primorskyibacter flagellatus]
MTGNCKLFCWIAAAIAGLILWLGIIGGFWGFVIGAVAAVVLGWLLVTYVCKADDLSASAPAGSSQSPDAVAAPPAAPAPGASPAPVAAPMAGAAATTPATAEADRPANAGAATAAPAPAAAPVTGTAATDAPAAEPVAVAPAPAAPATETVTEPAAPIADENATNTANVAAPLAGADAGEGTRPSGLTAPRDGGADDLKKIKGVGPKLEIMLNEMGFYHFDQIAGWSADEIAWVDQNLKGFKGRATRDSWIDQAATLATGGDTEFSKRVDKGGVY